MSSKKAVLGLVANQAEAEALVKDLQVAGFSSNDISALFPDKSGTRDFALDGEPTSWVAAASRPS